MSRRVTTRSLIAHHLRLHAGSGVLVGLLVFLLALLATGAPMVLGQLGDATLRDRLDHTSSPIRDVGSEVAGVPQIPANGGSTTPEIWSDFLGALEDIRTTTLPPLPEVLKPAEVVSRTEGETLLGSYSRVLELALAFDPGYRDRIDIVDGRLPEPAAPAGAIEIVLSVRSAEEMFWPVGETRTVVGLAGPKDYLLTGVFEPREPRADYWPHVPSVVIPQIFWEGDGPIFVTGTAYVDPALLGLAGEFRGGASTRTWFPVTAGSVQSDDAEQVAAALRKLTAVSHSVGTASAGPGILGLRYEADVADEIEIALAQQNATLSVITMLFAGPVGVAAAVLLLGCRLILEGRRASVRLLSARGASAGQLRGVLGVEGAVSGVLPAILGAAAASVGVLLISGAVPAPIGFVPAALIALAPVGILMTLAPSAADRPARADLGRRASRVRLLGEGLVAALAAAALILLLIRGYSDRVDLLLAATPLLLALVACLLTLRLYPLPLRVVFSRARARAGLDAFLGAARALREPRTGLTPVLALVVGVSVAVSSAVLLSVLDVGVADAARAQIGADVRITGGLFNDEKLDRIAEIDGVAGVTGISGATPATLDIAGLTGGTSVFVVDSEALRTVQGDGPGMLPPDVSLVGAAGAPVPLLSSSGTAEEIGSVDEVGLGGVAAEVVGVSRGPVPIGEREDWVAIDQSYAADTLGRDPNDRTVLVRLDDGVGGRDVEAQLRKVLGSTPRIDTAVDAAARVRSGPSVQGVRWALLVATALAALLSALAIVMTLALAAGPRAHTLALLRTLGAPSRSASSLSLWEIGPPATAAVIGGTVFGALVPLVVMAGVDLSPFTGSTLPPGYALDPAILARTLGGFVVAAAALTALALFISRRVRAAAVLRIEEEG
ncbi:ABC transporter permease [Microbacterium terregens]|uniref:ABC transporter permease n=1 Tax=Microbacterium terregens TaxID=69363 RepID=A0ABV5SVH3_9MICO